MILHLHPTASTDQANALAEATQAITLIEINRTVLITPAKCKEVPAGFESIVAESFPMDTDIQLASRNYQSKTRTVRIGDQVIGGDTKNTAVITGPCSVESREQIQACGDFINGLGLSTIRGGCYKPRTSPYSFQGMGLDGLKLLAEVRDKHGLQVVTEVRDASHVADVIEWSDVIQIGAKSMYDHGILKACGKTQKPVLLKRGFGTTLQEFVQCAEFILSGGNPNVILCERGIRTFENNTRFTLDLCGVAFLKEKTNLPVVLDPSHAMGYAYGIKDLSRACMAMGIDGLLIETHPDPSVAKSDTAQQLTFSQFEDTLKDVKMIGDAMGYDLV